MKKTFHFNSLKAYTSFWENFLNFNEKSSRAEYWWAFLWNWLIRILLLVWGIITILKDGNKLNLGIILFLLYSLVALIPSLSLTARRYQDALINKWWMVITYLLPYGLYFVSRYMRPVSLKIYVIQNLFDLLIFLCFTIAIIIPIFPHRESK